MHGHTHQYKHKKNTSSNKELQYRQTGEEYAIINSDRGNSLFEVTLYATNQIVMAKARGSLIRGPRKQRLEKNNFVLLVQDDATSSGNKYYIIHKYSQDDVKRLRKAGELTQVKESEETDKITVAFENDVITKKHEEIEIDDDFISNI
jgi:hypothetical protein